MLLSFPQHVVAQAHEVSRLDGKFAQVLELYDDDGAGPIHSRIQRVAVIME